MNWVALGWFLIVTAILIAVDSLVDLTFRRCKPQMAEPGPRTRHWQYLFSAVCLLILGVNTVTHWQPSNAARWLQGTAAVALLIWTIASEAAGHRRSRENVRR
jgi:hypothetical protein